LRKIRESKSSSQKLLDEVESIQMKNFIFVKSYIDDAIGLGKDDEAKKLDTLLFEYKDRGKNI